ncbi:DNA-binding transcriptional MerR regulator [Haloactinospora alba]|uniref:DNA-binding transcriptional MerR regulator n=1 Tax=Haloactinospora alba TaxID=405555 RepID=A0A543N782_9ACTN|nr:MerR family transcriptional regulator [Haloactinospora alba]TQN27686.1 DNA-binding transcriptional MerR regulator [Haloactinospora alba]
MNRGRLDDEHYPAYSMGRAAAIIGVQQAFLRSLEGALLAPSRSQGGHRRYSRHQLELAARARELLDEGMPVAAATRIVELEMRVERDAALISQLRQRIAELEQHRRTE